MGGFPRFPRLSRTGSTLVTGPDGLPGWRCRRGRYLLESEVAGCILIVRPGSTYLSFEADTVLHEDGDRARWAEVGETLTTVMAGHRGLLPRDAVLVTGGAFLAGMRWPRALGLDAVRVVAAFMRSLVPRSGDGAEPGG